MALSHSETKTRKNARVEYSSNNYPDGASDSQVEYVAKRVAKR